MRYSDIFPLVSGAVDGSLCGVSTTFNLNSMFSPTGGATQPYGFDQMAALYGRYKVYSVTISLTVSKGTDAQNTMYAHALIQNPSGGATLTGLSGGDVEERPNGVTWVVGNIPVHWNAHFDISTLCGINKREFEANVEDYAALVSASPARIATMQLAVSNAASAQTSKGVDWRVLIEYDCVFFQRITQADS